MGRGRRKALYRSERDSLKGSHEEAELQRQTMRRGKNLAFGKDTCIEKEGVRSKMTPRKYGVGLKRKQDLNIRRLGWKLSSWESTEKKEAPHLLGLRGRHPYSDQHFSRIRAPCMASTALETKQEEQQIAKLSA